MTSPNFDYEIAEALLVNSAALEKAAAELSEVQQTRQACQEVIPSLVELAVKTAAIEESERDAFAAALADPVKALKLFKFALEQRSVQQEKPAMREIGKDGKTVKQAHNNLYDVAIEHRAYSRASQAFDEALGFGM